MTRTMLRILYFGLPLGALYLIGRGHTPRVACIGHREAPGLRRLRRGGGRDLLLMMRPDLEDARVRELLASAEPDVILSFFWPRRIPRRVLDLAPLGAFGVHPSLLPAWRGPDPYFWALLRGDRETGVSLHRLEPTYDTGAVVAQRRVTVGPRDTAWSLARRLDRPALELLAWCADQLQAGAALPGTPQDDTLATQAPQPDEAQLRIDWRAPSARIARLVRAAAPYPGASAQLAHHVVAIVAVEETQRFPRALDPGEAYVAPGPEPRALVRTGDSALWLLRARDADDRALNAAQIAALLTG